MMSGELEWRRCSTRQTRSLLKHGTAWVGYVARKVPPSTSLRRLSPSAAMARKKVGSHLTFRRPALRDCFERRLAKSYIASDENACSMRSRTLERLVSACRSITDELLFRCASRTTASDSMRIRGSLAGARTTGAWLAFVNALPESRLNSKFRQAKAQEQRYHST